ncbi:DoxX-like family protein [Chitinophaga costaii]|uniref:DoxX-like family protein n=1 Tax=Chitinophaga costaii TaxID=1335309 RepID=A0A1C4E3G6_9BACT|nr:DoxX family protein [Chitinophaga costaii]PUZ24344.1 DoxX family protein [Chitinophaga costaii]SCC38134.1 DoxX-like family protein [Chitinophaga costaii]
MKAINITYWISTILISLMMAFSAYSYFTNPMVATGFAHLGYPDYFRVELGLAKILGVLLLLIPQVGPRVKEWAYAGFTITFISALIAHTVSGDPVSAKVNVMVALVLLLTSYFTYHKWKKA